MASSASNFLYFCTPDSQRFTARQQDAVTGCIKFSFSIQMSIRVQRYEGKKRYKEYERYDEL